MINMLEMIINLDWGITCTLTLQQSFFKCVWSCFTHKLEFLPCKTRAVCCRKNKIRSLHPTNMTFTSVDIKQRYGTDDFLQLTGMDLQEVTEVAMRVHRKVQPNIPLVAWDMEHLSFLQSKARISVSLLIFLFKND